jgi:integrase
MPKKKNAVRKDGLIRVRVFLGRDDNGKPRYKDCYGHTQKEADEKALQVKTAMHKGLDVTSAHDTFGTWAERWLSIKKKEVSAGRVVVLESHLKHLKRYLEFAEISKIRASDIQTVILDLAEVNPNTKRPMSRETLSAMKNSCGQILQLAIDNRVMDYNPIQAVKIPKVEETTDRRALSSEEQVWIIDTPHRAQRAAMIMMYAGLRRGELLALTWNDIDLKAKTITIDKTVNFVHDEPVLKNSAKTDASLRTIDIPKRLVDFLAAETKDGLYVCTSVGGKIHTSGSWRALWESYLLDLNFKYGDFSPFKKKPKSKFEHGGVPFVIPNITPHWLRHTFATMLYLAGVDILTAKVQLGHSDIKTTLDIYTHLDAKYKRKSMNKLDRYLKKGVV